MSTSTKRRRSVPRVIVSIPDPLPCPFCGGAATYNRLWTCVVAAWQKGVNPSQVHLDGHPEGRVRCTSCGARSVTATHAEAVRHWNRRA